MFYVCGVEFISDTIYITSIVFLARLLLTFRHFKSIASEVAVEYSSGVMKCLMISTY